jgi:DedD protein
MDRRVKERLVGASILVVLIVLIVPELLSGPAPGPVSPKLPVSAPEPVRNVTVDLATSKPPAPEPAVEAAPASGAQSAEMHGGGATSAADEPAQTPPAVPVEAPKAAPAPLETAPPPPTSPAAAAKPAMAGQNWAVQLGSFASHANAEKLVHQVKSQGFPVYVLSGGSGASVRYRVRVGPMADRGAATQALAKLKASGHAGTLVVPGA